MADATESDQNAWALLALKSAPASPSKYQWDPEDTGTPIAIVEGKDFEYVMRKKRISVGRNSSQGDVDINMGHSTFISRIHIEIYFENMNFFLICNGKNGVFVDDIFQRRDSNPLQLPSSCWIRFPSTQIRLKFKCLVDENNPPSHVPSRAPTPPALAKKHNAPLKVHIPEQLPAESFASPVPSPTGTISAANSCPGSPRGSSGFSGSRLSAVRDLTYITEHARDRLPVTSLQTSTSIPTSVVVSPLVKAETFSPVRTQYVSPSPTDTSQVAPQHNVAAYQESCSSDDSTTRTSITPPAYREESKPPYSYAQLIIQSIASSPEHQLTLSGIYNYIQQHYPYYRATDKGWQNSIRHNLSLNRYFVKVPRAQDEPGKGSFWRIENGSESKLIEQAFRKRRTRGVPCFRSPLSGSPRSDFTSPSSDQLSAISSPAATVDPSQNTSSGRFVVNVPPSSATQCVTTQYITTKYITTSPAHSSSQILQHLPPGAKVIVQSLNPPSTNGLLGDGSIRLSSTAQDRVGVGQRVAILAQGSLQGATCYQREPHMIGRVPTVVPTSSLSSTLGNIVTLPTNMVETNGGSTGGGGGGGGGVLRLPGSSSSQPQTVYVTVKAEPDGSITIPSSAHQSIRVVQQSGSSQTMVVGRPAPLPVVTSQSAESNAPVNGVEYESVPTEETGSEASSELMPVVQEVVVEGQSHVMS